jgi:hypothetical protein
MPHTVLKTSAGKVFHILKAVSITRWLGNQRWNQQAEFSSVFSARNKSSSAVYVIVASVIAPLIVQILLARRHKKPPVIVISKAA